LSSAQTLLFSLSATTHSSDVTAVKLLFATVCGFCHDRETCFLQEEDDDEMDVNLAADGDADEASLLLEDEDDDFADTLPNASRPAKSTKPKASPRRLLCRCHSLMLLPEAYLRLLCLQCVVNHLRVSLSGDVDSAYRKTCAR
jgi:hypothetical protein